jgi:hypothetical protein
MTGSSLAPIVIPLVVTASLVIWLIMVYHAARHPQWGSSQARAQATRRAGRPAPGRPRARTGRAGRSPSRAWVTASSQVPRASDAPALPD